MFILTKALERMQRGKVMRKLNPLCAVIQRLKPSLFCAVPPEWIFRSGVLCDGVKGHMLYIAQLINLAYGIQNNEHFRFSEGHVPAAGMGRPRASSGASGAHYFW